MRSALLCSLRLQILSERILHTTDAGPHRTVFDSYELNVILEDGTRKNVVDHAKEAILRDECRRLAEFLGVPIQEETSLG